MWPQLEVLKIEHCTGLTKAVAAKVIHQLGPQLKKMRGPEVGYKSARLSERNMYWHSFRDVDCPVVLEALKQRTNNKSTNVKGSPDVFVHWGAAE